MPKEKGRGNGVESKVACLACRRAHKKCDRKLPSCARCSSKGWSCNYDQIDRRFKPVEVMNELNNDVGNSNVEFNHQDGMNIVDNQVVEVNENWIQHSMTEETIRIYKEVIYVGVPCFSNEDYANMLRMSVKEMNETRKDILALLLSIQCLCENMWGFLPAAQRTAEKSRDVLRIVYEDFGNPFVASSFLNLSSFYSVIGNVEMAKGYLAIIEHFCSKLEQDSTRHVLIEKYNCKVDPISFKAFSALVEINCSDSYPIPDIVSLKKLYGAISDVSQLVYNLDSSLEKRIEGMTLFVAMAINETSERPKSELSTHILDICLKIFVNGLNIVRAIINGSKYSEPSLLDENTKIMEYYAYEITKLCQDPASVVVPPYVTSFIVTATKLNFEIFKSIVKGDRKNNQNTIIMREDGSIEPSMETVDYHSVMMIELNTLKQLSKRYPYVHKIFEEVNDFIMNNGKESMIRNTNNNNNDIQHFINLLYEEPSDIYSEMKKFIDNLKKTTTTNL